MDKKWICFIGLIFLLMDVECNSPPPLTNGNYTVIIPNQLLAYYCVNGTNFTRFGTTVITLQNQNNQWPSSLNNTCVKPSTVNVTATCKPPATPPSTAVSSNVTTGLETIMNAYVCPNGTFWITGIDVRLSTCENGNWTEIYDFCDVGCLMRKHCGDIAAMGMMTNASYNVISTGNIFDPVSSVLCYFTSSGNWTTIFNNGMTLSFYSYYYTNYQSYKNVYNSYYSKNYFIGLDYLANVSKSLSLMGSSAKMILECNLHVGLFLPAFPHTRRFRD